MKTSDPTLSVIVPLYNESAGLADFHASLVVVLEAIFPSNYEIIYCDDGSHDNTVDIVQKLKHKKTAIKLLKLSRHFGKEIATTAGIHAARGKAIMTIDADGQHPVELVLKFVRRWQAGARVVIGVRTANQSEGIVKRTGSKLFYGAFKRVTGINLMAGSTDYRLIDRSVQKEFIRMTERNRITRGLIDWLGYEREYIEFVANPRLAGDASYSFKKLVKLAINSAVSLSISPLYVTAYIGAVILPLSAIVVIVMLVNLLFGDPLQLHANGSAYVMMLLLFLIGLILVSQGIIGLYLSHIHAETQNRPLYVIDQESSDV